MAILLELLLWGVSLALPPLLVSCVMYRRWRRSYPQLSRWDYAFRRPLGKLTEDDRWPLCALPFAVALAWFVIWINIVG